MDNTLLVTAIFTNFIFTIVLWKFFEYQFDLKDKKNYMFFFIFIVYFVLRLLVEFNFEGIYRYIGNGIITLALAVFYKPIKKSFILIMIFITVSILSDRFVLSYLSIGFGNEFFGAYGLRYLIGEKLLIMTISVSCMGFISNTLKNIDIVEIPFIQLFIILLFTSGNVYLFEYIRLSNASIFGLKVESLIALLIQGFLSVMIFYVYIRLFEFQKLKEMNKSLNIKIEAYHHQNALIVESENRVRETKHNLKNTLINVRNALQNNNLKLTEELLDKQIGSINQDAVLSRSGNVLIDGMINLKGNIALYKGINIKVDTQIATISTEMENDVGIIIGIALDNAIEASEKVIKDAYIDISVIAKNGIVQIVLENSYKDEIKRNKNGAIISSKNNDNHGFGLISIRRLCNKHSGSMDVTTDDNIFTLNLLLYDHE